MTNETKQARIAANYYVSEHFRYTDFICPCCDMLKIVPGFYHHIELLETLYARLDFPFIVTSGYRCAAHNRSIGGAPRSWHLLFATDIAPVDLEGAEKESAVAAMEQAAREVGFGGIGRYEGHIHLDCRPEKAYWRG